MIYYVQVDVCCVYDLSGRHCVLVVKDRVMDFLKIYCRTLVERSCSATCGLNLGGLLIMSQTGGRSMSTWREGIPL